MSDRQRVSRREPGKGEDKTPAEVAFATLVAVYPEARKVSGGFCCLWSVDVGCDWYPQRGFVAVNPDVKDGGSAFGTAFLVRSLAVSIKGRPMERAG